MYLAGGQSGRDLPEPVLLVVRRPWSHGTDPAPDGWHGDGLAPKPQQADRNLGVRCRHHAGDTFRGYYLK